MRLDRGETTESVQAGQMRLLMEFETLVEEQESRPSTADRLFLVLIPAPRYTYFHSIFPGFEFCFGYFHQIGRV